MSELESAAHYPAGSHPHKYEFPGRALTELSSAIIGKHCNVWPTTDARALAAIQPETLALNYGVFTSTMSGPLRFPTVVVQQQESGLLVFCACAGPKSALCEHQAVVLLSIVQRKELRLFFDKVLRQQYLLASARDFGINESEDLDAYFDLTYSRPAAVAATPKRADLYPVTAAAKQEMLEQLMPAKRPLALPLPAGSRLLILDRHRYYGHLTIHLAEAGTTAAGKLKSPVALINPLDGIWQLQDPDEVKFYTALGRFQHNYDEARSAVGIAALRAIVRNPHQLPVYAHKPGVSDKPTAKSLLPVQLRSAKTDLRLRVTQQGEYYEVRGELLLDDEPFDLTTLAVRYEYFLAVRESLYLLDDLDVWRVVEFFQKRNNTLLIHHNKFAEFQRDVLANLEDRLHINYGYVRPATPEQRVEGGFGQAPEPLLYLTDAGAHVELLPVLRYGPKEVPVLSRRQLYATDELGRPFLLTRDAAAEARLLAALLRHYPDFQEQLNQDSLYVPKTLFLSEEWFLEAFEDWRSHGITVLGFNQLKNNVLNSHKARVKIRVTGETNWFDTTLRVKFGRQQASLQNLHKAVRNKSRYVHLDDGTRGILPQEWMEKFAAYFEAGEVVEERIRTPKISFVTLAALYAPADLTPATQAELARYQAAAADFTGIAPVAVPKALRATLREYQQQGLNWLNFLDTFNFGGCLADDMGLGKTLQVLAFILLQREKGLAVANLVVVPTSLVFNWQAEVAKFAPSLRVHVLHGASRRQSSREFYAYDIVLTTYNTVVSDIQWLKDYCFNYVFLDESQAIKNPDSLRYQAACLLQARNRVVITGTPVENNTYDLYGQLSFACPGLLGSRQHFQDQYAARIDKFKDARVAQVLRQKVNPFVLRRTKAQVATELPDKTEMVLYCEMGTEQRQVYEACRQEFRAKLMGLHEETPGKSSLHILQGLTKLRQICNSPALLPDEEYYGPASAKLKVLLEEISTKSPQHKILIFSQFVAMLNLIRGELDQRGVAYQYLTGQTRNRAAAVTAFQEDASVRVFLISLKAGGTGINLPAADYVYLVDPWWNPAVENQAIDRSHRIGQTKKVVAVRLICPDTIEEKIMKLQETKRALAHDLVKTDAAFFKELSRQELLALVT
ncbi:DEAD/DEAH box helicase [Hymenobacter sp. B1770]|uniref:DEAD/DEAH box helicase n=1 Tax=Hymenobacter sp. B1770 TaxID=1718788 RepID=UPI003CF0D833